MTNTRKITTAVCIAPLGPLSRLLVTFSNLAVNHDQDGRTALSSRPALYRPPVFLSEDPNATLSLSAIYYIV